MSRSGISAILFDLDGTLIDSLPGIEASVRWAVTHCLPAYALPDIRSSIGPPMKAMMARLWPELSPDQLQNVVTAFREHYDTEGCLQSRLFEGVAENLRLLQEHGIEMFVLTNKPARSTMKIIEFTGLSGRFRAAVSPDSSDPPFAVKSAGAARLKHEYELNPATTLIVGDGIDDAEAAHECGFRFVAAAYGYGNASGRDDPAPFATLKSFSDIAGIVL